MGIVELLVLAVGLSMDAFAVAVCKGLALGRTKITKAAIVGIWFGVFQGVMPFIGWLLGTTFADYITAFDHWVAFVLLCIIGGNMIREAVKKICSKDCGCQEEEQTDSLSFKSMLPMAVATSIDALAVGITFAFIPPSVGVGPAVCIIGVITFALSTLGTKLGSIVGAKYETGAELAGGIVLCLLGIKILLEHLGVLVL